MGVCTRLCWGPNASFPAQYSPATMANVETSLCSKFVSSLITWIRKDKLDKCYFLLLRKHPNGLARFFFQIYHKLKFLVFFFFKSHLWKQIRGGKFQLCFLSNKWLLDKGLSYAHLVNISNSVSYKRCSNPLPTRSALEVPRVPHPISRVWGDDTTQASYCAYPLKE